MISSVELTPKAHFPELLEDIFEQLEKLLEESFSAFNNSLIQWHEAHELGVVVFIWIGLKVRLQLAQEEVDRERQLDEEG